MEELPFSSQLAHALVLRDVQQYEVAGPVVVVNLASSDALVGHGQSSALPTFSSTVLYGGTITGALLAVLSLETIPNAEQIARDLGWVDFYGGRPGHPVLLRSAQHTIGTVQLDPAVVLRQPGLEPGEKSFAVKANLWFSPAGTDCGIHNRHDFIEVHTQIAGLGHMQKFTSPEHATLYEDQQLSPGNTNPVPFCLEREGTFVYPWHQYRADTDCIWLALEYHLS
ncbi:hypothetical protein JOF48_001250 [Arthrobacter stackebrandtii]|uniref:Uncharacterized protein n=1 Tax=Arthrobacter stackebrandtii TaxID=272161 RepID=A0ABS4YUH7_9MICC|nr:hypothetical protein [Arthrobacter stackebrandtii]MBP2412451.1 hypothetical protein [Arthrobacter stackebrandtii]